MPENTRADQSPSERLNQERLDLIDQRENAYARMAHAVIDASLALPATERQSVLKAVEGSLVKSEEGAKVGFAPLQEFTQELVIRTAARFPLEVKMSKGELAPDLRKLIVDILTDFPTIIPDITDRNEQEKKYWQEGEFWKKYFEGVRKIAEFIQHVDPNNQDHSDFITLSLGYLNEERDDWKNNPQMQSIINEDVFLELLSLLEARVDSRAVKTKFTPEDEDQLQKTILSFTEELKKIQDRSKTVINEMQRARN